MVHSLLNAAEVRDKFDGARWGRAALILAGVNLAVLVFSVQVLGPLGINLHITYGDRLPRWAHLYPGDLALAAGIPLIAAVIGLFADKKKSVAGWALAGCLLLFIAYGCAAE
ncbi:MAG TPA: hypothetical protein VIY53_13385 [Acidobacteriaceae bacterium]